MKRNVFALVWLLQVATGFLFSIALSSPCLAKDIKYDYIFCSTNHEYIHLRGVQRTDSTTTLYFRSSMDASDRFRISGPLCLVDEQQRRYGLLHADGIKLDEYNICPLSGDVDFSMTFAPLPKEVKIFDMVSTSRRIAAWQIYGIHPANVNVSKITKCKDDVRLYGKKYITPGKVFVRGRFTGDTSYLSEGSVRLANSLLLPENFSVPTATATINQQGMFELSCTVENPHWAYLECQGCKIPLFLIEGDTIDVTVNDWSMISQHITYNSAKGNYLMQNLMAADPNFTDWKLTLEMQQASRLDKIIASAEQHRESVRKLCGYLTWKYNLSPEETHLLRLELESSINLYWHESLQSSLRALYPTERIKGMSKQEVQQLLSSKEIQRAYEYLKHYDMEDYAYFMIPYNNSVHILYSQYLAFINSYEEGMDTPELLEMLWGKPLEKEWRRRIFWPIH